MIIRTDLPTRLADGSREPWATAGDWDRAEWRVDGKPHPSVQAAYLSCFRRAVEAGFSQADAREQAEHAAHIKHQELTS